MVALYNLLYLYISRWPKLDTSGFSKWLLLAQIPLDIFVFTVIIHSSGGVTGPVFVLYFLYVFVGLAILPARGTYFRRLFLSALLRCVGSIRDYVAKCYHLCRCCRRSTRQLCLPGLLSDRRRDPLHHRVHRQLLRRIAQTRREHDPPAAGRNQRPLHSNPKCFGHRQHRRGRPHNPACVQWSWIAPAPAPSCSSTKWVRAWSSPSKGCRLTSCITIRRVSATIAHPVISRLLADRKGVYVPNLDDDPRTQKLRSIFPRHARSTPLRFSTKRISSAPLNLSWTALTRCP